MQKIGFSKIERFRERKLKAPCNLEKWKTLIFLYLITNMNYSKRRDIIQ